MKKTALTIALFLMCLASMAQDSEFCASLKSLDGVVSVTELGKGYLSEKYEIMISQPVSHSDSSAGCFCQRVIVGFRGYDRPNVFVTEGYSADYYTSTRYHSEIADMLDANIIICEHRYFGKSVPDPCVWDFLTEKNSLADLHRVRQIMGSILKAKWLSTGISKGGSSCTFYRAAYPDDVDASVAYVAPINRSVQDGRHKKFLNNNVGSKQLRCKMRDIQQELMNRKDRLVPMLDAYCQSRSLKFHIPIDQLFDFEVLELEFSIWQWGHKIQDAPKKIQDDDVWLKYLVNEVDPDYFCTENKYIPFYHQVLREFGYYSYDIKRLGKNASLKSTNDYVRWVMLPEDMRDVKFDPTLYKSTEKFLKSSDPTHIFIYGEYDPWTASGVASWLKCSKKNNMRVYVQKQGCHASRISSMPANTKKEITALIKKWME